MDGGVTLQPVEVSSATEFADAFSTITRNRADALLVDDSGLNFIARHSIIEFAAKDRLAAVYAFRIFAVDGGLLSYGVARRAALEIRTRHQYEDRQGARPDDPARNALSLTPPSARANVPCRQTAATSSGGSA